MKPSAVPTRKPTPAPSTPAPSTPTISPTITPSTPPTTTPTATPTTPTVRRLGLVPTDPTQPAVDRTAVILTYKFATTSGASTADLTTAIYNGVAAGTFTKVLQGAGFPSAVVSTIPIVSRAQPAPTPAPTPVQTGLLGIGAIVGVVVAGVVSGCLMWLFCKVRDN